MNSYWIDSTKNSEIFQPLNKNITCDVCIIGAGMFGITTAYYLSNNGINVVLLDRSQIGTKTSGHTTAKITSQHGLIYDYLIRSFGVSSAKEYLFANEKAIKNIKKIIDEEKIECDFQVQNNYVYTEYETEIPKIEKEYNSLTTLGFKTKLLKNIYLPFETKSALMFPNQAMFHPRKYMIGLCDCILKKTGKIYTNSLVTGIKHVNNHYEIHSLDYVVKSKYVVLASHYPFINFPGFYFTKMYQETSYIIGVDPKKDLFDGMYITSSSPTFSFRTTKLGNKDLLLIGGAGHKTGKENETTHSTFDILEEKAKKMYPNCEVLYKWNTRDCITLDKVPYIGDFSNLMPNMYIGTGFNKWGMTTSNVAANIICNKILGIKNKYETVFSSTRLKPLKNIKELKNMITQTTKSLVINKIKLSKDTLNDISNNSGKILEIDGNKVGIYKDDFGKIYAVKPICTHLGCLLSWNNIDKTWDCPCHGSRFNYDGLSIDDPSFKNLETYNL